MLRVCCIDLWQAAPMRRKCRLADTWLTQRVLLDSWNVTLFQGAECCTLNLSPSNNHFLSNMPAHAECGNDRSAAEGKHRANHVCAFRREVTLKLTVLITKYNFCFFMQIQTLKCWKSAKVPTYVLRHLWPQREDGEEILFWALVGKGSL